MCLILCIFNLLFNITVLLNTLWYSLHVERDTEEILKYLEELASDNDDADIQEYELALMPPTDGADSDRDDAPSEDEGEQNLQSLGRKILSQKCELNVRKNDELVEVLTNEGEANIERPSKKKKSRHWTDVPLAKGTNRMLNVSNQFKPTYSNRIIEEGLRPIDVFKEFFNADIMSHICSETIKYAQSKGAITFKVTVDELFKFFGVLILSGYVKVPNRNMYWEVQEDAFNIMISNAISRNRFKTILQYLHFNDNSKIDVSDKLYKIRPLIEHLNAKFQLHSESQCTTFSIDEAMEPYYGRNNMKQFIRGKPIRFGFKFWCLNTSTGYLIKFIPYTGKTERDANTPLGESVVKKLSENIIKEGSVIFIDNYFTSLQLLEQFKNMNINIVGTIRKNRIEKAPLPDLKKTERGAFHTIRDKDSGITLIRWHDNSVVTMATNIVDDDIVLLEASCTRYSGKEKKKVSVPQPHLIKMYNGGMGGVDLFDQQRGLYRIRIRSNKWYWPMIRFMLNSTITNAWFLYREAYPTTSLLQFTRDLVYSLLAENLSSKTSSISSKKPGPKPSTSRIRFDGLDHLIVFNPTQRKCAVCKKCAKFICEKCNMGLHPKDCFKMYHVTET